MKKLLFCVLLFPVISFSQGKLKKTKQSLQQNSTTINTSNSLSTTTTRSRASKRKTPRTNRVFNSLLADIMYNITFGLAIGKAQPRSLNSYPYAFNNSGGEYTNITNIKKNSNLRLGINSVFSDVNGLVLNAIYKPLPILGIYASHLHFSEKNRRETDFLDITSVMINYHRFREKEFTFWWGVGGTYVGNEVQKIGFSYTIGTEIYPVKPISVHLSWKESFINSEEISEFRGQLKYHIKKTAIFTGYHNFELGSETISGMVLGIEYTF